MDNEKGSRFVRHITPTGFHLTFVTITCDGKEKEFSMWALLNKYGPDRVLEMRAEFPEVEE